MRSGAITSTEYNYTNQRKDAGTGLLFYNARYYDPALGRFLSADSIVSGSADGTGGAAASLGYDEEQSLRPLTVDFHETDFVAAYNAEVRFTAANGFHFQLSDAVRHQETYQWGPQNAQALNRYTYVLNSPLRYTDPSGHRDISDRGGSMGGMAGRLGSLFGAVIASPVTRALVSSITMAVGVWGIKGHNKLSPNPNAVGPHTQIRRDPLTGEVRGYETYKPQSNPYNPNPWESEKRYDNDGRSHYNKETQQDINTPHVHDPSTPGKVRKPNSDEIPQ